MSLKETATTFDRPKTKAMRAFLDKEGPNGTGRVVGFTTEPDGVFLYTASAAWCDDAGSGTFRADSETGAIACFRERVRPASVPTYTHALLTDAHDEDDVRGVVVKLADLPAALRSLERAYRNFQLFDANRAKLKIRPEGGGTVRRYLCRDTGGWSYGHIQNGWICAGAGGLNSMPVLEL